MSIQWKSVTFITFQINNIKWYYPRKRIILINFSFLLLKVNMNAVKLRRIYLSYLMFKKVVWKVIHILGILFSFTRGNEILFLWYVGNIIISVTTYWRSVPCSFTNHNCDVDWIIFGGLLHPLPWWEQRSYQYRSELIASQAVDDEVDAAVEDHEVASELVHH